MRWSFMRGCFVKVEKKSIESTIETHTIITIHLSKEALKDERHKIFDMSTTEKFRMLQKCKDAMSSKAKKRAS